jgi:hypothetical protein
MVRPVGSDAFQTPRYPESAQNPRKSNQNLKYQSVTGSNRRPLTDKNEGRWPIGRNRGSPGRYDRQLVLRALSRNSPV